MDRVREGREERRRRLFPPSPVSAWLWRKRLSLMRWERTRRSRRLVVVGWVGVLVDWLWMTLRTQPWGHGGMDGWFSIQLMNLFGGRVGTYLMPCKALSDPETSSQNSGNWHVCISDVT